MWCNDKLKTNKLVQVQLPSPQSYFAKYGSDGLPTVGDGIYTGDVEIPNHLSKTEILSDTEMYMEYAASKKEKDK